MKLLDEFFSVKEIRDEENGFVALLQANPEHFIYKAHFPGNPITPGVCIVQTAGELLQRKLNRNLFLKTVKNVKFLSTIVPSEGKLIKYSFSNISDEENGCKAQLSVSDETQTFAKISVVYSYEPV